MKSSKLSIYSIVKQISYEVLLEELLQYNSEASNRLLQKFSKKHSSVKLKFLTSKIINSVILAIQPIFLLFAYMNLNNTINDNFWYQIILFLKAVNFEFFFIFQFFNFLILGIFNLSSIMSEDIYEWVKTFPLSRKDLKKLLFYTIYHNINFPLITNLCVFPIIMLIATQNILVLLISIGISFLNTTFSLSILIIFSEKLVKYTKKHNSKTRKPLFVQLINIFSYVIIIFGGIFFVEILMNITISLLLQVSNLAYMHVYNIALFLIPFPFNVSYLILIFSSLPQMPIIFWLNLFYGLALYLIALYFLIRKSFKSLDNALSLQVSDIALKKFKKKEKIWIKVKSHCKAFIRKDLLTASRDIQTSLYFIMPLIMSVTFAFFFNFSLASGNGIIIRNYFFNNWLVMLGFAPILSAMIVYNVLSIDELGRTIIDTLPIIPREQAKSKIYLIVLIAVISPTFLYVLHYRFIDFFLAFFFTIPYVIIYSLLTFLLRTYFFGEKKHSYTLDIIRPQNKINKWALILIIDYVAYIFFISLSYYLYFLFNFLIFISNDIFLCLVIILFLKSVFDKYFPNGRKNWSRRIAILLIYSYILLQILLLNTIITFSIVFAIPTAFFILTVCLFIFKRLLKFITKVRNNMNIVKYKPKKIQSDKKANWPICLLIAALLFFLISFLPRYIPYVPSEYIPISILLISIGFILVLVVLKREKKPIKKDHYKHSEKISKQILIKNKNTNQINPKTDFERFKDKMRESSYFGR